MAITTDDFNKIWASTSPLTPYSFSESQYKEGWNFIGSTPPSRQMWDFLQKQNDEKLEYLLNNFDDYAKKTDLDDYAKKTDLDDYLPLSGGTMFGWLSANQNEFRIRNSKAEHDGAVSVFGGDVATTGANLYLYGTSRSSQAGSFVLSATDGANQKSLRGQADGTLTWNSQPLLPVGIVQAFAGTTIPNGWLLCDGSAVSRTDYAALFAVIGTTYGAGNGSTTFNLPNLVDKFVEGSTTAGTVKSAGLPNITGDIGFTISSMKPTGAFGFTTKKTCPAVDGKDDDYNANIDASRSSSIYGSSTTVQPPALTMRYIIKY